MLVYLLFSHGMLSDQRKVDWNGQLEISAKNLKTLETNNANNQENTNIILAIEFQHINFGRYILTIRGTNCENLNYVFRLPLLELVGGNMEN
jgi:hypothetical protein